MATPHDAKLLDVISGAIEVRASLDDRLLQSADSWKCAPCAATPAWSQLWHSQCMHACFDLRAQSTVDIDKLYGQLQQLGQPDQLQGTLVEVSWYAAMQHQHAWQPCFGRQGHL